jgi:hypothetical protein
MSEINTRITILLPDPNTERRDEFGRRVRDCPKCKGPMTRKFT